MPRMEPDLRISQLSAMTSGGMIQVSQQLHGQRAATFTNTLTHASNMRSVSMVRVLTLATCLTYVLISTRLLKPNVWKAINQSTLEALNTKKNSDSQTLENNASLETHCSQ